jgi:YidC/Oxa1 family membrane protein insertase
MRQNALNLLLFLALATSLWFLWPHVFPNPQPQEDPATKKREDDQKQAEEAARQAAEQQAMRNVATAAAGFAPAAIEEATRLAEVEARRQAAERAYDERQAPAWAVAGVAPTVVPPAPIRPAVTLIPLGDHTFFNQVLLTSRGGGVQQVILPEFEQADRLGRGVAGVPLHLIPGVPQPRDRSLTQVRDEQYVPPDLKPGVVADPAKLAEPAFTIFHYATPDNRHPDPYLGEINWEVVEEMRPAGGEHKVVFEAELGDPYFVKFRKTYTLGPKDYHFGLRIEIERLPGGQKGQALLRYQLSGPRGLPVEGEWYTYTTRVALVGWVDAKGAARRQYNDAATVGARRGGEAAVKGDNTFKYMAVATQYFTSAVAIDDTAEGAARNPWAYVRATTELPFDHKSDPTFLTWTISPSALPPTPSTWPPGRRSPTATWSTTARRRSGCWG